MDLYDPRRACAYCHVPFPKASTDRVEHEANFYHALCLAWMKRPRLAANQSLPAHLTDRGPLPGRT